VNQKKWRLIDDDIIIGLIYNFKTKHESSVTVPVAPVSFKRAARATLCIDLTWLTKLLYLNALELM
jgi:hypothetical protein